MLLYSCHTEDGTRKPQRNFEFWKMRLNTVLYVVTVCTYALQLHPLKQHHVFSTAWASRSVTSALFVELIAITLLLTVHQSTRWNCSIENTSDEVYDFRCSLRKYQEVNVILCNLKFLYKVYLCRRREDTRKLHGRFGKVVYVATIIIAVP